MRDLLMAVNLKEANDNRRLGRNRADQRLLPDEKKSVEELTKKNVFFITFINSYYIKCANDKKIVK